MFYVKVPLRYLLRNKQFEQQKREILKKLATNAEFPSWAVSYIDLGNVKIEEEVGPPKIIVLDDKTDKEEKSDGSKR